MMMFGFLIIEDLIDPEILVFVFPDFLYLCERMDWHFICRLPPFGCFEFLWTQTPNLGVLMFADNTDADNVVSAEEWHTLGTVCV